MKPRILVALLICSWLFAHTGVPEARAQTGELDLAVSVDYQYGLQARFTLSTDQPARVQRAHLYYYVGDSPQLEHRSVLASPPGAAQPYEVTLDLVNEPLPPFSTITCWWRIETSDGFTVLSPKTSFFYSDNRREWQALADPPFEIRWTETDADWPDRVLPRASAILSSLETLLGLPRPDLVSIFVYSSAEDLRGGLLVADSSFASDYAVPAPGVLLLAASGELLAPSQLDRIVARGLTEALLYDATRERYENVPGWFRDGLGMLMVPGFDPEADSALAQAMGTKALPLQEALCAGQDSPPLADDLRSAQAASFLKHLFDGYGQSGVLQILSAYAEGASCDKAVKQALGRSLGQLEMEWLGAKYPGAMVRRLAAQLSPWLLLLAPVLVLVALSVLPPRRGVRLGGRRRPWSQPYESPDSRPENGSE